MTYRDDRDALRARAEAAERQRDEESARADAAEATVKRLVEGEPGLEQLRVNGSFNALRVFLGAQTGLYLLFSLMSLPIYIGQAYEDPIAPGLPTVVQGLLVWVFAVALFAPMGVGSLVGLIGLSKGRRWGWGAAVLASGASLLCGCFPIGVFGLIVLFQPRIRQVFLEVNASGSARRSHAPEDAADADR